LVYNDITGSSIKFRGKWSDNFMDANTSVNVVKVAYNTSANARPQVLSNGWIVFPAIDSGKGIYFYISKDNGKSIEPLCNIVGTSATYFSVCSYGTMVYCLRGDTAGWSSPSFTKFDATLMTGNPNLYSNAQYENNNITADTLVGAGCYIVADGNGYLHAVWCSKVPSYPNSFNIRYSKSTDGGITWSAPIQVSTATQTNYDWSNPILLIKNGNPIIIAQSHTDAYYIACWYFNGSSWGLSVIRSSSNNQVLPSATITNDGVIHVVWTNYDWDGSGISYVSYSCSSDNVSWSGTNNLTNEATSGLYQHTPCITSDDKNNIYVYFEGRTAAYPDWYNIRKIAKINNVWSGVSFVTTGNTAHRNNISLCDNYKKFIEPLAIYQDTQAGAIKFNGRWTISISALLLKNVMRMNITPFQSVKEISAFLTKSKLAGFTTDGKVSIVPTGSAESYTDLTETVNNLDSNEEVMMLGSVADPGDKVTLKVILNRASTSDDPQLVKLLGGVD
jgi:hypothetical protein